LEVSFEAKKMMNISRAFGSARAKFAALPKNSPLYHHRLNFQSYGISYRPSSGFSSLAILNQ